MKRLLCIVVSLSLSLSLSACDRGSPEETAAGGEDIPQESGVEYQTYRIDPLGIEFDCPVDFGSDVSSTVISENEAFVSVSAEGRHLLAKCTRIAAFDDFAPYTPGLYEDFNSLDLDENIATRKATYETFELLDSFSTPDSYGFYYLGTDSYGDTPAAELSYQYKNHGGFANDGGVINVYLLIIVPETMDHEEFFALCEAITGSLRWSDGGDSGTSTEVGGDFDAALEPLEASGYEAQCAEIVDALFHYAPLACYDGPRLYLQQLLGGDEALFQSLSGSGGLLEGADNFTSEWTIQDCGESGKAANAYYINVNETRTYYGVESGNGEYAHTIYITINCAADYRVTGVDSVYNGPVDGGHEESTDGQADGSFVSIYDDEDGIFDGPPNGLIYKSDGTLDTNQYWPSELEAQRTYGANAQIENDTFNYVLSNIHSGDLSWVTNKYVVSLGGYPGPSPARYYQQACEYLEYLELYRPLEYTKTPLYELVLYRYQSAVLVWGTD